MSRKNAYQYNYFERGIETRTSLYSNYRWIPELTIPMAATMIDYLGIKRGDKVLDIGCAKGFLVKALRWMGREAYGFDISDYALKEADPEIKHYLSKELPKGCFHFAIAKDVFEHINMKGLCLLLTKIQIKVFFIIVPLGDGVKYYVPSYELDTTHIHRQPLAWWNNLLKSHKWNILSSVTRVPGIKDNWSCEPHANGFIVAKKNGHS